MVSSFDYIVFPNQPVELLILAFSTFKRRRRRGSQKSDDAIGTADPAWARLVSFLVTLLITLLPSRRHVEITSLPFLSTPESKRES